MRTFLLKKVDMNYKKLAYSSHTQQGYSYATYGIGIWSSIHIQEYGLP